MDVDERLSALASRQHGVVAWTQAREIASVSALRHRVAHGDWVRASPRVLRRTGSVRTFRQQCQEGVFDAGPGSTVSHLAAAAYFGVPGFPEDTVEVSRHRTVTGPTTRLAVLHRPRFLPPHHITVVDGIPVTTVARTLFDLASCCHPGRVGRAIDNAQNHKLVTLEEVRRTTIELLARGRPGTVVMRELLEQREAGYIPPGSGLEADFLAMLVAADMPLPEGQAELGGEDGWVGRVDFYYRDLKLVIEIDGKAWHTRYLDKLSDKRRDAALRAAGFEVEHIKEEELEDPDEVIRRVRQARTDRSAALLAAG